MLRIVVGSTNPVKVGAVAAAFRQYYPDCDVVGVAVESGVAAQPMSEKETMNGARQRAHAALAADPTAQYGVGLEGGVTTIDPTTPNWTGMRGFKGKMFECAWVCIVKKSQITNLPADNAGDKFSKDEEGLGGGLYFELPAQVAERIRAGGELGPIMDELVGENDIKQKMGAIGLFSAGKLDRKTAYVHLVLQALIKFVSPEWFTGSYI
jgi:non-canonical (house-cleaning) NTP pyrophosphatase